MVLLLAPLASGHHDGLVPDLVHDSSLAVHELGRDRDALAEHVVEAVEERPLAARRGLLDRTHAAEVVAEAHAHRETGELARRARDEAHRVALAVDGRVRAQAGEAGRLRCLEAGPAPLERRAGRRVADDHVHDRAAAGPARGCEVGCGDLETGFAVPSDERPRRRVREHGARSRCAPGPRPRPSASTGEARTRVRPDSSRRLEPADAQISLLARGPQDGAREKGVLVLPVVPVRARLHGVDRLPG